MTTSFLPAVDSRSRFFDDGPAFPDPISVAIGAVTLDCPVMPASGCFGPELGVLIPMRELGASVTKTVFGDSRGGNPAHRLTEIAAGMVNSVGIPSRGPAGYLQALHPLYEALGVPVIVSVGGHRPADYAPVIEQLGSAGSAYEMNVSCPNLDRDGVDIGADPSAIEAAVSAARKVTSKPILVKLPIMTSSIADSARAAEAAGADALCIANSLPILPLTPKASLPALGNLVGGLTGPTLKPVVLRLVWQAARAVKIPIVACGGVESAQDALDYFSVGACAVQVGTANFARPFAMVEIARELRKLQRTTNLRDEMELSRGFWV